MATFAAIKQFVKEWTLPLAITVGTVAYLLFANVPVLQAPAEVLGPLCENLLPVAIFCTLLITFSKVDFKRMRIVPWHLAILLAQLLLVALVAAGVIWLRHRNTMMHHVLEAMLTCVIAPCASAAPVVVGKLGGNLTSMTTFTLLSSVVTALLIPVVFPLVEPAGAAPDMAAMLAGWWDSFVTILYRLAVVLLLPLMLGAVVRHLVQPLYRWIVASPDLNFYCWCVALSITSGITVKYIDNSNAAAILLLLIAVVSLLTAVAQFVIGRWIGSHTGEHICTGQAMFQKNTALAIWITYTYLTPIASIGAGCYVLWQNIINSFELWQMRR